MAASAVVARKVLEMPNDHELMDLATIDPANITAVEHGVDPTERVRRNGHAGAVLWFTGLPGAGKSTLAMEVERRLFDAGYQVYVVDGDNIRHGLSADLGFSPEDRTENVRRVGELAALFADAGIVVIAALISPDRADRARARRAAGGAFHEIFIDADVRVCEQRDPKGLYRRARAGEIPAFTGVSAPYDRPERPALTVDTVASSIDACASEITAYAERHTHVAMARRSDGLLGTAVSESST